MFKEFEEYFHTNIELSLNENQTNTIYDYFMNLYNGKDFGSGIYRVFSFNELEKWEKYVDETFSTFRGHFKLFGYDWLGRCFGIYLQNTDYILLFDVGLNKVFTIPHNIVSFHNVEIPQNHEFPLISTMFSEWHNVNRDDLKHSDCVGYIVPPFLSGLDELSNMEVSDMDVYWGILGQIIGEMGKGN